jgi:hypothetical protein
LSKPGHGFILRLSRLYEVFCREEFGLVEQTWSPGSPAKPKTAVSGTRRRKKMILHHNLCNLQVQDIKDLIGTIPESVKFPTGIFARMLPIELVWGYQFSKITRCK